MTFSVDPWEAILSSMKKSPTSHTVLPEDVNHLLVQLMHAAYTTHPLVSHLVAISVAMWWHHSACAQGTLRSVCIKTSVKSS